MKQTDKDALEYAVTAFVCVLLAVSATYGAYKALTTSGAIDYCYVEHRPSMNGDAGFDVKGHRPWTFKDSDLGYFATATAAHDFMKASPVCSR